MSDKILYILMRNDLASLNAGKAMAQASHASNQFIKTYRHSHVPAYKEIHEWESESGFGTVLVLAVNDTQLLNAISQARQENFPAEEVSDPTYPYRASKELADLIPSKIDTAPRQVSGDNVTLYREEFCCGFVFGTKEELKHILGQFPLHP